MSNFTVSEFSSKQNVKPSTSLVKWILDIQLPFANN